MKVEISIIVPCYNQAQYLNECLHSVMEQTYQNWECIIVDDGSPDDTELIAGHWVEQDKRFKYYKKQNGGVASARNFGINQALGKWILPLDGDDKIGSQYLELASQEFNKNYTLIYCKGMFFGDIEGSWNLSTYSYQRMLIKNHIFCSAFFKKTDWLEKGGYDTTFIDGHEDWDFWLSILNPESEVLQLDYYGFFYRRKEVSRDTLLHSSIDKQNELEKQIYLKHLKKYMVYDPNPLVNYQIQDKENKKLEYLLKKIKKNIFSRLLHKIIEKI